VDARGTVGVTWDDFRRDRRGDNQLTTDVWFAHSHDRGATFAETHLAGTFDMLTAPPTSSTEVAGRFVGDYQGLAPLPDGFGAIFAQAQPPATEGPSDVFFGRVVVGELPRIRLSVRPRRVRAGRRTRFRFRALAGGRPVAGATIRFAGRRRRTSRRGGAAMILRLGRLGRRRARAAGRGLRDGTALVRVLPRRRR
jgi:hypothetical protein